MRMIIYRMSAIFLMLSFVINVSLKAQETALVPNLTDEQIKDRAIKVFAAYTENSLWKTIGTPRAEIKTRMRPLVAGMMFQAIVEVKSDNTLCTVFLHEIYKDSNQQAFYSSDMSKGCERLAKKAN